MEEIQVVRQIWHHKYICFSASSSTSCPMFALNERVFWRKICCWENLHKSLTSNACNGQPNSWPDIWNNKTHIITRWLHLKHAGYISSDVLVYKWSISILSQGKDIALMDTFNWYTVPFWNAYLNILFVNFNSTITFYCIQQNTSAAYSILQYTEYF